VDGMCDTFAEERMVIDDSYADWIRCAIISFPTFVSFRSPEVSHYSAFLSGRAASVRGMHTSQPTVCRTPPALLLQR
jgi:hypothetical protein